MVGREEFLDLLNLIKQADVGLMVHVEWAVRVKQCKRVVMVSNDTNTFALLLYYTPLFQTLGMKETWQPCGTGEKRHMISPQQAASQLAVSDHHWPRQ